MERAAKGPLGAAGLETTQCEGRPPSPPQNQSSPLLGEQRKDKDARPRRRAAAAWDARRKIIFHVRLLNMASKRDYSGDDSGQLRFQDIRDSVSLELPNM